MDAESHELSHGYTISLEDLQENRGAVHHSELLEMQCMVCRRTFIPWIEINEGLDHSGICRDCKSLVLDDNGISLTSRNPWGRQRRRRSRYGSSESVESVFSQQFSHLIGLARQNRDPQQDEDTTAGIHHHPSYTYRNLSRRGRRMNSDTDNDSIERMDSMFGETDSHVSFSAYGGDSDASVDVHSIIDRETPSPLDNESRMHTDTDIDPMHAGLDQWTSDDQADYGAWEEVSVMETSMQLMEPHGRIHETNSLDGSTTSPQNSTLIRWQINPVDLFTDIDEIDLSPFTGNLGDYMDAQGFEELLEQLAEADSSRRGAPPAAASSLRNLPRVIISKDHEKNGTLICAVCKDPLSIDAEARQLPCSHLYHPSCILPWLRTRNSCPVCRYELPTDDSEYEEGKHNNVRNVFDEMRHRVQVDESYSDESSALGDEADEHRHHIENQSDMDGNDEDEGGSNHGGNRRWLLIAAAPIVTIVGIAIVTWVRNSIAGGRIHCGIGDRDAQQSRGSHGRMAHASRNRTWWSLF
ncbi:uncharacterized protein LOC110018027 [Phalaenopsis equestris]|uniref:uncharacterized protein LOC110018027 n=1 Tax=Phalaenopsis equestris TaxID=78828 RepID=UPI0009E495C1|nr:uncharacterized protein LOC110018027 [Phalaenopsis equestris]XP_020570898.1 uncharacterized protein LOC110018027 [Phalaenopsis equestris]XP_020570900.1 uncharacterized protein LOC110018027 [Phalaenopsis equestris]